jgi:hypothetical protein
MSGSYADPANKTRTRIALPVEHHLPDAVVCGYGGCESSASRWIDLGFGSALRSNNFVIAWMPLDQQFS